MNITVNARLQNGLLLQGGFGTGRQVLNDCEVVDDLPEMLHTFFGDPTRAFFFAARPSDFCEQNNGWRTSVQGLAAYTIPKIDVQVSGTLQNLPGGRRRSPTRTTASFPASLVQDPFVPFQAFQIVEPGEQYVERLNQIDLRVAKYSGFGIDADEPQLRLLQRDRIPTPSSARTSPTVRRGGQPTSILMPRLFKFSAQFDF